MANINDTRGLQIVIEEEFGLSLNLFEIFDLIFWLESYGHKLTIDTSPRELFTLLGHVAIAMWSLDISYEESELLKNSFMHRYGLYETLNKLRGYKIII